MLVKVFHIPGNPKLKSGTEDSQDKTIVPILCLLRGKLDLTIFFGKTMVDRGEHLGHYVLSEEFESKH